MKIIRIIVTLIALGISFNTYAQKKAQTIKLEQTPGVFTQKTLELKPGKYIFQVSNKDIDHEVAFALAPKKEAIGDEDYIQEAFLANPISSGQTAKSKEVILKKGEYVYFCPMNPTPQYTLVVK